MLSILLAGAAALALSLPAVAQMSPGTASGAQVNQPAMGGADVGRSGGVRMGTNNQATSGTGAGNMGTNPGTMGTGAAMASTPREMPRDGQGSGMRSSSSSNRAAMRGNDREPPATSAQIRREEQRQTGPRAARATRPEDRAHMGGGVILENERPVGTGDMATNAMGGPRGAVQPGTGGPVGTGRNAGTTPGGGD